MKAIALRLWNEPRPFVAAVGAIAGGLAAAEAPLPAAVKLAAVVVGAAVSAAGARTA